MSDKMFEPCNIPFYPGDSVFAKIENKVYEGKVTVSGLFYDERYAEPLYVVIYRIYVDNIPIKMKWYSTSKRDKPYKTYEEASKA